MMRRNRYFGLPIMLPILGFNQETMTTMILGYAMAFLKDTPKLFIWTSLDVRSWAT